MALNGHRADPEERGDLEGAPPIGQQSEHFELASRQRIEVGGPVETGTDGTQLVDQGGQVIVGKHQLAGDRSPDRVLHLHRFAPRRKEPAGACGHHRGPELGLRFGRGGDHADVAHRVAHLHQGR